MKLLLDQNVSPRLAQRLADIFPNSAHVETLGLGTASDNAIWEFARSNEFTIVSKDGDFSRHSLLHGWPPKFLWLMLGNCTTSDIEQAIRSAGPAVAEFAADATTGTLIIR